MITGLNFDFKNCPMYCRVLRVDRSATEEAFWRASYRLFRHRFSRHGRALKKWAGTASLQSAEP